MRVEVVLALAKLGAVVDDLLADVAELGLESSGRGRQLDGTAGSSS